MILRTLTAFNFLLFTAVACAQVRPAPGAKLNYTQVMFEYGKVKNAVTYLLRIQEDTVGQGEEVCNIEQVDSATAMMINDLEFGKKYTWSVAGLIPGKEPVWQGPYSFEIPRDTLQNNVMTMEVSLNDEQGNAGGLIVNDCTHTVVDRTGKMVWYLNGVNWQINGGRPALANALTASPVPGPDGKPVAAPKPGRPKFEMKPGIYDLRVTPFGTFTELDDSIAVERDINGAPVWRAPNDGQISGTTYEHYNHHFCHLPNGHYLVLGSEVMRKLPDHYDTAVVKKKFPEIQTIKGKAFARVDFGTIIEYDKSGKIVWSWKSDNYFDSDMMKPEMGSLLADFELKPHINALSVDPSGDYVYAGFRDVSRIIKIEKKTGNVVDSWGALAPNGRTMHAVPFHQQHDANVLEDGNIVVFNNNDYPGRDSIPGVIVFSQKPDSDGKVLWRYDIDLKPGQRRVKRTGGNVDKLKNGNYLICLGDLDRIMEVTPGKKIVWQADIKPNERRSFDYVHRLYRAHYTSSLYPCYFVFTTDKDVVRRINARFKLRIFNRGSEPDSYAVKVTSSSGAIIREFTTDTVLPGLSTTFIIKPNRNVRLKDKIEVSVSSQTNPDMDKRYRVLVGSNAGPGR